MRHEEAISEALRLLDDNKKRQFPFLTEKEESAIRTLLEGFEAAKDTWIPIEECTPVEGEVVEIVSISKADRARYTPSNNLFFPWSLIDWPTPETEEGTFSRRREAVTHWRRGPELGGEDEK